MSSSNNKDKDEIGDQMQEVMELMTKRGRGEATNAQVEMAVNKILSDMGTVPPPPSFSTNNETSNNIEKKRVSSASATAHPRHQPQKSMKKIKADTDDYDDDDDEDQKPKSTTAASSKKKTDDPDTDNSNDEDFDEDEDDNGDDDDNDEQEQDEAYKEQISLIPMGKHGAQMMTTFGDGPRPTPKTVSAALLGTRQCLQVALLDARALRRQEALTYAQARQSLDTTKKSASTESSVDPQMLYRAFSGYDKLGHSPKCGFDIEQLQHLFPEEMTAYLRWKTMHSAYQESSAEDKTKITEGDQEEDSGDKADAAAADEEEEATEETNMNSSTTVAAVLGGHLNERAAQFDLRTERMKRDWYIKFAKVRQGSFLPRGIRHRKTAQEKQWEKNRKPLRGRAPGGVWETMSSTSVQFLHWLGFDPPAMPPPNEETTQALAFLGYDMLGKLVEKVGRLLFYFTLLCWLLRLESCRPCVSLPIF
jgi:hypothetical protein